MNVNECLSVLISGIDKLNSIDFYKQILNKNNNLFRFNTINRILVEMQFKDAYDIKTADEWEIENRQIKKGQKAINIIVPLYKSVYIDNESGKEITDKDGLTLKELNKAIELGIASKIDTIDNLFVQSVFDIKQTKVLYKDSSNYNIPNRKLSNKSILELLHKITGYNIEKSSEFYLSKGTKTIFIDNKPYYDLVNIFTDIIIEHYLLIYKKDLEKYLSSYNEINLLKDTIKYSIGSMLLIDMEISFSNLRTIESNKIFNILSIADSITTDIINYIDFDGELKNNDIVSNINLINKAEALLNIFEANKIYRKMKGL